jgi:WD40 repeat protein
MMPILGWIVGGISRASNGLGLAVLAVAACTGLQAVEASDAQPPLPPRALVRIGTDDLRTRNSISGIAFSPDGRFVAASESYYAVPRISLFDVRTGRLARLISPPDRVRGSVQCVAFSPDGTELAWGESEGEVALWDLAHDRLVFREKLHGKSVNDLAFSPGGQTMASGGEDGAVHLRRVEDRREVVQDLATGERKPVLRRAFGVDRDPALGSRDRRVSEGLAERRGFRPGVYGPVARRRACGGGRFRHAPDPRRHDRSNRAEDRPARVPG